MARITRRSLLGVLSALPFGALALVGKKPQDIDSLRVPTGTIVQVNASALPDGWLPCDGRLLNKADYQRLYNVIGSTYNDSLLYSRFQLPNLRSVTYLIKT
jgi:hypothetical protein